MKKFGYLSLFCLVLLLAAALLPTAALAYAPICEWEISADGNSVYCSDGRVFDAITASPQPLKPSLYAIRYFYYNGVYLQDYYHEISSPSRDSGLLYVSGDYDHFFVTEEAAATYAAFLAGEEGTPILIDGAYENHRTVMSEGLYAVLIGGEGTQRTVEVTTLRNAASYTVNVESTDKALLYTRGTIFRLSAEEYGFVDHTALANSCFDANGNLSFRSGTVTLTLLDSEAVGLFLDTVEDLSYEYPRIEWFEEYENDVTEDYDNPHANAILFYVIYILLGFALPLVPLTLGLVHSLIRHGG